MLSRVAATAGNAAEWLRYGGFDTDEEPSPYRIVSAHRVHKIRHYFPDDSSDSLPVVLVPPLMMLADMWDVGPRTSAVAALHREGIDAWVVDFGRPDREPGGLLRNLADHVVALSAAVDEVRKITGRDVVLAGQSQGGMFCYQTTAYRRGEGIDSVVTFGAPVDTRAPLALPLSPESAAWIAESWLATGLAPFVSVPGWVMRNATRMIAPVGAIRSQLQFIMQLHDREALLPRERQRRFLDGEGWTYYSGPAFADLIEQFLVQNRMLKGGFVIGEQLVTLADIDRPILTVVGESDVLGHPMSVRGIRRAAPRAEVFELTLKTGHFGLIAGSTANRATWPNVASWVRWRAGEGEFPVSVVPAAEAKTIRMPTASTPFRWAQRAADLGVEATRLGLHTSSVTASRVQTVLREGASLIPLLNRLQNLRPDTVISLGLVLDEAFRRGPGDVVFVFGDRVIRRREVKHRVDSIVKGLISLGVRPGERVGVLMGSRPSAFSLVAAISRLGATSVLLRPEGDLALEASLGGITWLVSDLEHAPAAGQVVGVTWCVLGGGIRTRDLPPHVIDMEQIDPDTVPVPAWYRPNPRRAADVAFVTFTGVGQHTKPMVITNRRWALSALGTASAAAIKPSDTVYSVTPLHHSSALLMAVGGAVAAGARFAIATSRDRDTFWDEVRRYGATHVSYTWTSLREITNGPEDPAERDHSIRLFFGSGMPVNLWDRVSKRFAPAAVLEFYASAEGEATLANLRTRKPGAMGRPLPGTAEVKVAAYDADHQRLAIGMDGLGRECGPNEIGLLVARLHPTLSVNQVPMRSVFSADDAWESTGDLFSRDEEGDLWLLDPVDALIPTKAGLVPPAVVRNALGTLRAVDLVVVYGVPDGDLASVVAAITLMKGAKLSTKEVNSVLSGLDARQRPHYVQVVQRIPVTTWARPVWQSLRKAGIPRPDSAETLWRRRANGESYERIRASGHREAASKKSEHKA